MKLSSAASEVQDGWLSGGGLVTLLSLGKYPSEIRTYVMSSWFRALIILKIYCCDSNFGYN